MSYLQKADFDWQGLDEQVVRGRFENLDPLAAIEGIEFKWDLSEKSRYYNDEGPTELLLQCGLYSCDSFQLMRVLDGLSNYLDFEDRDDNRYLRLVGLLDRGTPLFRLRFQFFPSR